MSHRSKSSAGRPTAPAGLYDGERRRLQATGVMNNKLETPDAETVRICGKQLLQQGQTGPAGEGPALRRGTGLGGRGGSGRQPAGQGALSEDRARRPERIGRDLRIHRTDPPGPPAAAERSL